MLFLLTESYVQDGIEDVVFSDLVSQNDVRAHIHVSWLDPAQARRMMAAGSRCMAVHDDMEQNKIRIYAEGIDKSDGKSTIAGETSSFLVSTRGSHSMWSVLTSFSVSLTIREHEKMDMIG